MSWLLITNRTLIVANYVVGCSFTWLLLPCEVAIFTLFILVFLFNICLFLSTLNNPSLCIMILKWLIWKFLVGFVNFSGEADHRSVFVSSNRSGSKNSNLLFFFRAFTFHAIFHSFQFSFSCSLAYNASITVSATQLLLLSLFK